MKQYYTPAVDFYRQTDPQELLERFGSPLYVYSEVILRQRCRDIRGLVDADQFSVNYSTKANSNLHLLKIIREEGLQADAMSPGEIHVLMAAGFKSDQIFYVCNNVSTEEMAYAVERDITVGLDSLSQLESFGQAFPGSNVAVRFNMGYGAGHHEKVVTAGKKTKFGINDDRADEVKAILKKYDLKLRGINQHIGSLFLEETAYITSAEMIMELALSFDDLEFIDLGGGFGIPYMKQDGQQRLDLPVLGDRLKGLMDRFTARYGRPIRFKVEPGRYIVAESAVLLGTVHAMKEHSGIHYVGTDLGFNVLMRPVLYDSHHDIEVYRDGHLITDGEQTVTVVGNICETGDKLAIGRKLPEIHIGDTLGVMDAGAYGYSMASNYNNRLRPAEVLIPEKGEPKLIRRRDTLDDLMRGFEAE